MESAEKRLLFLLIEIIIISLFSFGLSVYIFH
jgi:hypothetical protein